MKTYINNLTLKTRGSKNNKSYSVYRGKGYGACIFSAKNEEEALDFCKDFDKLTYKYITSSKGVKGGAYFYSDNTMFSKDHPFIKDGYTIN